MQGYSGFFSEVFSVVSQKLIQGIVYFVRGVRSGEGARRNIIYFGFVISEEIDNSEGK